MTDEETKRSLPYISSNVWAELRSRFQKTLPAKITTTYLQTALGFSSGKAAQNLLPQLRLVGLIDAEGAPTALASRFRLDADYADVASEIVASVYPEEMRDLFPGPDVDPAAVAPWIMRHTGGGQAGAATQARFYALLMSGATPEVIGNGGSRSGTVRPTKVSSDAGSKRGKNKNVEKEAADAFDVKRDVTMPPLNSPAVPALHIDVQVHIDSTASVEQIEAVFASMARHIYKSE